jgi:lipopolysaccharide/colanic/teichoic acid biosynthesis glycosyltransferase
LSKIQFVPVTDLKDASVGTVRIENDRVKVRRPASTLRFRLFLKRIIDFTGAVFACILLAPVAVIIGISIKIDSPGPVFFTQRRRGMSFQPFTIVKFRSLTHGVPDPHMQYEMVADDPRITRVGAWLRKTSLDEIPQLINVVAGSMSLVGPRPLVEWESQQAVAKFSERFLTKPGLTGLSQLEVRNSVDFDARCAIDVEYVRHWSLRLDLKLLALTPQRLIRSGSIYPNSTHR